MKKNFLKIFFPLLFFILAWPVFAADPYGLNEAADKVNEGEVKPLPTSVDLPGIIGKILGSVLGFTGTIFFVLVIVAGLMWMTSAGNEERVKRAKQILVAALIGLIIVLSAYAITSFIGSNLAN